MEELRYSYLIILRYIVYAIVVVSIFLTGNFSIERMPEFIVLMLFYIVNMQVRIYYLRKKKYGVMLSLAVELIVISLIYYKFGGFVFVYYFISVLDSALLLSKPYSYVMILLFYTAVMIQSLKPLYSGLSNPAVNIIFNTMIVATFGALGRYIEEERIRKSEAQNLYDKLRISEENLKEAYEKLEMYSETVEELTILRERNRISRDIHDSVGHTLSTLIIQLQALPYVLQNDINESKKIIDEMTSYTKNGLENVRRTVRELQPTDFDNYQGIFAIQELVLNYEKITGIKTRLIVSKEKWTMNSDQSLAVYRIVQEALSNASRHGRASNIEICIQFKDDKLYIHIKDDGDGAGNINKGFGLSGIEQRVKDLKGSINIHSEKGNGFEINVTIPRYLKDSALLIDYEN